MSEVEVSFGKVEITKYGEDRYEMRFQNDVAWSYSDPMPLDGEDLLKIKAEIDELLKKQTK